MLRTYYSRHRWWTYLNVDRTLLQPFSVESTLLQCCGLVFTCIYTKIPVLCQVSLELERYQEDVEFVHNGTVPFCINLHGIKRCHNVLIKNIVLIQFKNLLSHIRIGSYIQVPGIVRKQEGIKRMYQVLQEVGSYQEGLAFRLDLPPLPGEILYYLCVKASGGPSENGLKWHAVQTLQCNQ